MNINIEFNMSDITERRIVVLGRGFLGKTFEQYGIPTLGRDGFEYTEEDNIETVTKKLKKLKDQYGDMTIVNCIGSANTRSCEVGANWKHTQSINGTLPSLLSEACGKLGCRFIHISTGCVYDQNNEPQKEDDFLVSHCNYVVSKLVGELGCSDDDLIIRPRLYFGGSPDRNNLLTKISKFKRFLTEVNSFTSVETIVEAVLALEKAGATGVFNVSNTGYMSMVDVAKLLFDDDRYKNQISAHELKENEGLFLVNNIMSNEKLEEYYTPRPVAEEFINCWERMNAQV